MRRGTFDEASGPHLCRSLIVAAGGPTATEPPVTEKPAPAAQACDHSSTGNDFVSAKVFLLSPVFDPKSGAAPSPSEIVRHVLPTDPYWNDLTAAFDAAPDFFKDKLCGLDGMFVVQNTCAPTGCTADDVIDHSWGFRQQTSPPKRYIATSAALWKNGSVPIFSAYKNLRLRAVLTRLHANGRNWFNLPGSQRPQFASASPDTAAMTVLAVLAHEAGHVLWFDVFVPQPGGSFNASNFAAENFTQGPCGPTLPSLREGGLISVSNWPINLASPIMRESSKPIYRAPISGKPEVVCGQCFTTRKRLGRSQHFPRSKTLWKLMNGTCCYLPNRH
jgi:hypothetical protein